MKNLTQTLINGERLEVDFHSTEKLGVWATCYKFSTNNKILNHKLCHSLEEIDEFLNKHINLSVFA
jgi:hypothetical protein